MVLQIVQYPDPRLKKKTVPIGKITEGIFTLADNMIETMLKNDGLGLSANQVGSQLRIFVINSEIGAENPKPIAIINPEILSQDGSEIGEEGCLSFPELYLKIERPMEIRIHAKNFYNESLIFEASGLLARVVAHEIDHLDGTVFIERADKTEEENIKKYLDNLSRTTANS